MHNTSLFWEVMKMLDKATLDILSELKLDELGNIVRRQDSVPEYISMPFDQRLQFAIVYDSLELPRKITKIPQKDRINPGALN